MSDVKKEYVIYYKDRDGVMLPLVAYDTVEEAARALDAKIKELGHSYYDHPYCIRVEEVFSWKALPDARI